MIILITLGFIVFDFVTGFIQAVYNKNWKSSTMREGLFHKLGLILAIVLAVALEYAQVYVTLPVFVPTSSVCCVAMIVMETGSALENLKKLNPEISEVISVTNKDD